MSFETLCICCNGCYFNNTTSLQAIEVELPNLIITQRRGSISAEVKYRPKTRLRCLNDELTMARIT